MQGEGRDRTRKSIALNEEALINTNGGIKGVHDARESRLGMKGVDTSPVQRKSHQCNRQKKRET